MLSLKKRLANGVGIGLISQFFADIIFTIATENIISTDIIISDVGLYYGAASAGIVAALFSYHLDKLALIPLSAITFAYVNNLVVSKDNEIILNTENIVFDIILTYVVTLLIDNTAINDYYNHKYQKKYQYSLNLNTDKSSLNFLFILTISNMLSIFEEQIIT